MAVNATWLPLNFRFWPIFKEFSILEILRMWLFSAFLKMVRLEFFGISLKNRLFLRKFSIFETGSKSKFYVCKGPHKVNRSEGKHAQTCLINQSLWAYIQYMYKVQFCTRKGGKEGFLFFEVKRDKVALNFSWLLNSVLF